MMPANIFFAKHPQTWAKSSNLHIAPLTALVQTVNTWCNLDSPSLLSPSMWDCLTYKGVVLKSPPPYVTRRTLPPLQPLQPLQHLQHLQPLQLHMQSEKNFDTFTGIQLTNSSSKLEKTLHAKLVKPKKVQSCLKVQKVQKNVSQKV